MNDFYTFPLRPDEIAHYGMPERSGRYAWGSGDRPYQRLEGKVSKMETRLRNRFSRADKVTSSRQKVANKKFEQAVRKSNSIFQLKGPNKELLIKLRQLKEKLIKKNTGCLRFIKDTKKLLIS